MKRAIKKFVIDNKKQIIFALFAFIYFYFINDSEVSLMPAPVAVAKGAKLALDAKKAATAAKTGAKIGAAKGAIEGANNVEEGESKVASAAKGAAKGAAIGAIQGGSTYKENIKNAKNTPKISTVNKNNDGIISKSESNLNKQDLSSLTPPAARVASALGSGLKKGIKGLLPGEKEESTTEEKKSINKLPLLAALGCVSSFLVIIAIFIPIIAIFYVNPISEIFNASDIENTAAAKEDSKISIFIEKAKNFFAFGQFSENEEVAVKKVNEVYNKYAEEKGVSLNIPLLLATIFSDVSANEEATEEKKVEIDNNMLLRIDYLDELAELQLAEDYVVYKCNSKDVDGELVYYKEISYDTSTSEAVEGTCDATTDGTYIKELSFGVVSSEKYREILKEHKDILADMYGEDAVATEEDLDRLIDEIITQKDIFNLIYTESEDEDEDSGNIPMSLFYDDNVNLTSPLKGNYAMTSSFGNRTGTFAGMHKGVDMVSNDHNIYAAGDGVVTGLYTEKLGGNVIEITHTTSNGETYITQYGHLDKFLTTKGATVKAGDIIGIMGATGVVSGTHLHFQVWKVSPYTLYNPKNVFTELQ